ncbi:hypothetical protein [uncultured Helcococcus sp.]|uniref:hypothetical protein n=1 Tax=uncultured Helcococcus sp. TaxID=1072508 RepID=UPI00288B374A|nr:hypothetical protein [uncultured Helcococcus sp.]
MDCKNIIDKIKNNGKLLSAICTYFQIQYQNIELIHYSSRSISDIRAQFNIDDKWILKIASSKIYNEEYFIESDKLIDNYNKSGIYAPRYKLSKYHTHLYEFDFENIAFIAWIEEYAPYKICASEEYSEDIKLQVLLETSKYMTAYTDKDLMSGNSMWSIIDLSEWDDNIDEKEENYLLLREALLDIDELDLVSKLDKINRDCREKIKSNIKDLRKCSIQADLNPSNILIKDGKFICLIDFNMAGKEVNINHILNETRYDLSVEDFESLSAGEILSKITNYRKQLLEHIFKYYKLDALEIEMWDSYRKIVDLFLFPNVSLWSYLIKENRYVDKIKELINFIIES